MRLRIQPRFWLIVIALMLITFSVSFGFAQHSLSEGRLELAEATARRDALRDEVQSLKTTLEFSQTDDYIIRVARDELGMIMPGEIRYISAN